MESTITPFLIEKWIQSFHFFDNNKDGVLTSADFAAIADHISNKTGASEEDAMKTRQEWVKWYHLLQPDPTKILDLDTYVNGNRDLFMTNIHHFRELDRTTASDVFDRMDLNKDGKISLGELNIFYEAVGVNDTALVKHVFEHLDKDGDGYIDKGELVDDWLRHFSYSDPKEGKSYLISYVMQNMV